MTIYENLRMFDGKYVLDYDPQQPFDSAAAYRLRLEYDDEGSLPELLQQFAAQVDVSKVQALVIGMWGEPYESSVDAVLQALIELAPRLSQLRALFVGDITSEECEISWIVQGDYSALLQAFPQLQTLQIRGGNGLSLAPFQHANLKKLVIQSGGLPASVLQALAQSKLPQLEHLELWLGAEDYGFDGKLEDCQQVVHALRGPQLRYLGLRDSEISDQIATWIAGEAWVTQLATLDLSLGTLGDAGGQALLDSPYLSGLEDLNLEHHYLSESMQDSLLAKYPDVKLDDAQEADGDDDEEYRYVAVSE
ncbi:STM4015 family protein [Massilia sp. W12]|uniref:STM4015 family protein n=1 Tax=Massilia sp. W12 TaxID=3126507 RepID=UPI0030CF15A0